MKARKIKFKAIKDLIDSNTKEDNTVLLGSFVNNRQNTQNTAILYRKSFLILASVYFMIYLGVFDPSILGVKFNTEPLQTRAFGFNNLMEFMLVLAPLTFAILYFFIVLSLIHRSILNIAINKLHQLNCKTPCIISKYFFVLQSLNFKHSPSYGYNFK